MNKDRIYSDLKRIVKVPSVSATYDEAKGADVLYEILSEIPYFAGHPKYLLKLPVKHDPLKRSNVAAFLPAEEPTADTVILMGHYDVMNAYVYDNLKDIAFDIEEITSRINELPLDEDSQKDFNSGEWIFGRGVADMKFGLAMSIEILRHYAENPGLLKGNLIFLGLCGEEANSEGMLAAVSFLNRIAKSQGLRYKALLAAESYSHDDEDPEGVHFVHIGATGKFIPMFFCVGAPSRGVNPFHGIDANLLSSEIYSRMHLNTDLCQSANGVTTPPPICLKAVDLKLTYSSTSSFFAASYYNLLTVDTDALEVMDLLRSIAVESFDAARDRIRRQANAFENKFGIRNRLALPETCVMTFSELMAGARANFSGDFDAFLGNLTKSWLNKEKLKLQDIAIRIVKTVYEHYPDKRPMIIISFIPPFYPDVYPDMADERVPALIGAVNEVMHHAKNNYGEDIRWKDYYMEISDLSFTHLDPEKNFDSLFENIVGANMTYSFPMEDLKKFDVPGIIFGVNGKDSHKNTERIERHYNFDVLPWLYLRLIENILG